MFAIFNSIYYTNAIVNSIWRLSILDDKSILNWSLMAPDSFFGFLKGGGVTPMWHPAETSTNSDICDFLKVSDIGKSIVLNGETYILNDTAQFSEDMREIYIWKNLLKYAHPNYVETFMDWIRMTQIIKHCYQFLTLSPTWQCTFKHCCQWQRNP